MFGWHTIFPVQSNEQQNTRRSDMCEYTVTKKIITQVVMIMHNRRKGKGSQRGSEEAPRSRIGGEMSFARAARCCPADAKTPYLDCSLTSIFPPARAGGLCWGTAAPCPDEGLPRRARASRLTLYTRTEQSGSPPARAGVARQLRVRQAAQEVSPGARGCARSTARHAPAPSGVYKTIPCTETRCLIRAYFDAPSIRGESRL